MRIAVKFSVGRLKSVGMNSGGLTNGVLKSEGMKVCTKKTYTNCSKRRRRRRYTTEEFNREEGNYNNNCIQNDPVLRLEESGRKKSLNVN